MKLLEFLFSKFKPKDQPLANVTVVRRYRTDNGYIGELYLDGKQMGVTCDNLVPSTYDTVLKRLWPFNTLGNSLNTLRYGEFTQRCPLGTCFVGSLDQKENKKVIKDLIRAVDGKVPRLIVLERLWMEAI